MSDSVRPHRRQPTRLPHPWDSPGKNTGVGCHFLLQCMKTKSESEVARSCPTLSDPMDFSPTGSPIHGIFQARVLEWGAIAFSVFMNRKLLFSFSLLQMVGSFLPFLFQHQCHLLSVLIFPWPSNLKQVVLPLCSLHKTWKTQNSFTSFPLELRERPPPHPAESRPSTVYSTRSAKTKF